MHQAKSIYYLVILIGICLYAVLLPSPVRAQTGQLLDAIGPINQSMGGAGVAMPLDAMGALFWNPASISGLDSSEIGFAFQVFSPQTRLSSSVQAGAFGPGMPAATISGRTVSDSGISPIPSFAFVCKNPESRWTYGISGFGIGGFGVDYAGLADNPINTPQPPNGFGFGPVFSSFQMMQISPTASLQVTERLSIGLGINTNWATLAVSPFSAAAPDDANGDGFMTYPDGSRAGTSWGLGFQTGLYYENKETGVHWGLSFRSPSWMQTYKINSQDELGAGRSLRFDLDNPLVASLGFGYSGWDYWKFAADVRYIDYEGTNGFQDAGFDASGAVTGFGWKSIFVVAVGAEYQLTPSLAIRTGYTYNENPIRDRDTFFNIAAPGIIQHHLSTGFTYATAHGWRLSLAVMHGFRNTISGAWQAPTGAIPGTTVSSELSTYSLTAGLSKQF